MKIMVEVEFEVELNDRQVEEGYELTIEDAMEAVETVIFNNLVLSEFGVAVVDCVEAHVDGLGHCIVSLVE
jgi:hypothetical protein